MPSAATNVINLSLVSFSGGVWSERIAGAAAQSRVQTRATRPARPARTNNPVPGTRRSEVKRKW